MHKNKILLVAAVLVLFTCVIFYYFGVQNHIDTPQKLFTEFVKAQKTNNFNRMKSISCPTFGSLSAEYNDKVFQAYYNKVSKYDFSNANFTLKNDGSKYFDLNNVMLDGEPKKIMLRYADASERNDWLNKDVYCMVYGSNF